MMRTKLKETSSSVILEWAVKISTIFFLLYYIYSAVVFVYDWKTGVFEQGAKGDEYELIREILCLATAQVYHLVLSFILCRVLLSANPSKGRLGEFRCCLWVLFYIAVSRTTDFGFDLYKKPPEKHDGSEKLELFLIYLVFTLMALHYKFWPHQDTFSENEGAKTKEREPLLKINRPTSFN